MPGVIERAPRRYRPVLLGGKPAAARYWNTQKREEILRDTRAAEALRYDDLDAVDFLRLEIRKRFQQDVINDAEDRHVGADFERDGDCRGRREPGTLPQRAACVTNVS